MVHILKNVIKKIFFGDAMKNFSNFMAKEIYEASITPFDQLPYIRLTSKDSGVVIYQLKGHNLIIKRINNKKSRLAVAQEGDVLYIDNMCQHWISLRKGYETSNNFQDDKFTIDVITYQEAFIDLL